MSLNKKLPNRQSIRLKGYDYSQPGFYFITICTKNRAHAFGKINSGAMFLNEFGRVARDEWGNIDDRYPGTRTDAFIVMPNHIHGIIQIKTQPVGAIHELHLRDDRMINDPKNRRKMLIPLIVGRYKMLVAKEINKTRKSPSVPLWHRNYYEHIIRNEKSLHNIREYIKHNPIKWEQDRFI